MKNRSKLASLILGLMLAGMLPHVVADNFAATDASGDKTMSDAPKQTEQKNFAGGENPVVISSGLQANRSDAQLRQQTSYEAPYPFTADELWKKLFKVIELPEGHVTKEQLNSIFGVTLRLDEENLKKYQNKVYYLKRGENWYFNMSVSEKITTESHFFFNWGDMLGQRPVVFPPPPSGMCIDAFKIMPSITQRGWVLIRENRGFRDIPDNNVYRKGKMGVLTIGFFPRANCLLNVNISASRMADFIVR